MATLSPVQPGSLWDPLLMSDTLLSDMRSPTYVWGLLETLYHISDLCAHL